MTPQRVAIDSGGVKGILREVRGALAGDGHNDRTELSGVKPSDVNA
jgi:hypothetical protein